MRPHEGSGPPASHGAATRSTSAITEQRADELLQSLRSMVARQVQRADPVPEHLGSWRIEKPLGHGGMGAVFRAVHDRTGKAAAVKTARSGSPAADALRHETRLLAGLDHRGIVQVFDHGEDSGIVWMAIQLVDGHTLQTVIRARARAATGAPLPLPAAELRLQLEWLRDFARALHAMHERGLVHRDVKPANLMIGHDGTPIVIDFGLSLDVSKDPIVDALAGTAPYMSPEQVLALTEIDGRSDVYSLAATFFELLSGQRLVRTSELNAGIFAEVAYARNPLLSTVGRGLPVALDAVFAKALAKPVGERYASAARFAEDVDRLLAGRPPRHAREPWRARVVRHRRSLLAGAATVAILSGWGWPRLTQALELADLRTECANGQATIDGAVVALDHALRLHGKHPRDQELEDVFARAVTDFAPRLTLEVFRRTALTSSDAADATFAGQIGSRAERILACELPLAVATRDELTVQLMFAHLRAERYAASAAAATVATAARDERIRLLAAIAGLLDGQHTDVGEVLGGLDPEYGNLSVDRLCCRAFLVLETTRHPPGPTPETLRQLATALQRHERRLDQANDARNFVAGLLALVRLRLDEPEMALTVLESRLRDFVTGPAPGERPVMALLAAQATFLGCVQRATIEPPRIRSLVEHLRAAFGVAEQSCESAATLMRRFVGELQQKRPEEPVGKAHFDATVAALFDELLAQGPPPRMLNGPAVKLMTYALGSWMAQGDLRSALAWARLFETKEVRQPPGESVFYDRDWRTFWIYVIFAAARDWPGPADRPPTRDLAECRRWMEVARRLVSPPHVEFEAMLALQRLLGSPEDASAREALDRLVPALEQRRATAPPLTAEVLDSLLQSIAEVRR